MHRDASWQVLELRLAYLQRHLQQPLHGDFEKRKCDETFHPGSQSAERLPETVHFQLHLWRAVARNELPRGHHSASATGLVLNPHTTYSGRTMPYVRCPKSPVNPQLLIRNSIDGWDH